MYADSRHERYLKECGKCGKKYPNIEMVTLMRNFCSEKKSLIKICEGCYNELLNFLGIEDVIE